MDVHVAHWLVGQLPYNPNPGGPSSTRQDDVKRGDDDVLKNNLEAKASAASSSGERMSAVSRTRRDNNEPPEAVLEGLAMAGLVGILRQLGDLSELAADVFQELHDQVMDASARGRRLAARAKQLEDDLHPLIDQEDFLIYDAAAPPPPDTERLRWHSDPKVSHGVVAGADMPSFIAECIKQCRGPPGLSILDKYGADGDGACLRRYTNPSFFRTNSAMLRQQDTSRGKENRPKFQSSEDFKPKKAAHTYARSETNTSESASPRFLSMLRQLKRRQTSGHSVFSSLKPQLQQNIQNYDETWPEEKASSVDRSEVGMSFTSSPDLYIAVDTSTTPEKVKENHQGNVPYCSGAGSADYGEQRGELERTSSFEAWLSQDFHTPEHQVTDESYRDTWNGLFSHGIISRDQKSPKANQDSITEEMSSKTENSCSEDAGVVMPPLRPIPPIQWLSVKVHTGPMVHRKSLKKYHHKPSVGEILKPSDKPLSEPACTDQQPEAEISSRQEHRPTEKLIEDHEYFDYKVTDTASAHGSTVSTSEESKDSNAADAAENSKACQSNQECGGNLRKESVFHSAVQELAKMSPPSVPRPKYSVLDVGSHGRYELRNGPSLIHPSRNLLDKTSEELVEQRKDKPFHGCDGKSFTDSRVATILQRAEDIRQAHADHDDNDSEDGWGDSD
ncbi:hypothetical protein QOZ80_7BG0613820 [Eleusine coracana subsp. coracana]|nr:hypothetical protein QOZ80_7BG0613820 [Eleusine coracana subsp. coracana]